MELEAQKLGMSVLGTNFTLPFSNSSKNDEPFREGWIHLWLMSLRKESLCSQGASLGEGTHSFSSSLSLKNKVWGGKS